MDRNNGSLKNGLAFPEVWQTSLETNGFKKIEIAFFLYQTDPLKDRNELPDTKIDSISDIEPKNGSIT